MTTIIEDHNISTTAATVDPARTEALDERLLGSFTLGTELLTVELGRRLGLYEALADRGPSTAAELAADAGITTRYASEWLDQQAHAGFVDAYGSEDAEGARRFVLPAEFVPVLLDIDHPAHLIGTAPLLLGVAKTLPAVADAYATSRGVEYAAFGDELRFGIASLNRPGFIGATRSWFETMPDVVERLDTGGTVLDAGCGVGWSSIGLARAFPNTRVVGIDLDEKSVEEARIHVAEAGLADRVQILHGNATDVAALRSAGPEGYDAVAVFQALHDMGEPARALAAFREVLADGGTVLIADEHGGDHPAIPAEIGRVQRAMSVLHCTPATWAESDAVVNGTVLLASTLSDWRTEAGFERFEILPVEHPFWTFYRLG